MASEKLRNFYIYLNDLFSEENLMNLLQDEVIAKAKKDGIDFTKEQLLLYLNSRMKKVDEGKQLDKYIKNLSVEQFKEKASEWEKDVKRENKEIEEILKKKINSKEELEQIIEMIKDAYEKSLKRKEYIKDLLKNTKDEDEREILKGMTKLFNKWIKDLDKIYEKKAENLSKYMVKSLKNDFISDFSKEELKKGFINLRKIRKEIMEIDSKIEVENIKGNANARKIKELRKQKRLKAEKMYYRALTMKTAMQEDIEKNGGDTKGDEGILLITRIANGFKDILDEEKEALAKDKAYKQILIDEGAK